MLSQGPSPQPIPLAPEIAQYCSLALPELCSA